MTWGAVETTNMTDAKLAADQKAEIDSDLRRGQRHALGREVMGFAQNRDGEWKQQRSPTTMGLPPALVNAALQAIEAETRAYAELKQKTEGAMRQIAEMGLSGAAVEYHLQITRGQAWKAYHVAVDAAEKACVKLGEATEAIKEARAVKAAIDGRKATAERQYHQALAVIERDAQNAAMILAFWGVS